VSAVGGVLDVVGGRALAGATTVPGDKSISHRALLLAALAEGTSVLTGLSDGEDVVRTCRAIEALGAGVARDAATGVVTVNGGRARLSAPAATVDLGNSGTGMRLLAGVVAGVPGVTRLDGDESLRSRPMDRVAVPLDLMGARVTGVGGRCRPPLTVTGGSLVGIDYTPPMASAQVKGAVLFAGLDAAGETVVREPVATRAHTEEMLAESGADVEVTRWGSGRVVRLRASALRPVDRHVPGDPSQAAFWAVAGVVVPGSRVTVERVHLGPERIGFVHVLVRMGAALVVHDDGDGTGSLTASHGPLAGTTVEAAEIPSLDEVPVLAVAALVADGPTRFRDVGELRVKESDRLAGTVALVEAFGGRAAVEGDDLVVAGGATPTPGSLDARGDHRMAMAAAVAGAACADRSGTTRITGWDAVATSYPGFADTLARLASGS
jgi:3-phosphoshikimate 1-carboxyvinyltransferase